MQLSERQLFWLELSGLHCTVHIIHSCSVLVTSSKYMFTNLKALHHWCSCQSQSIESCDAHTWRCYDHLTWSTVLQKCASQVKNRFEVDGHHVLWGLLEVRCDEIQHLNWCSFAQSSRWKGLSWHIHVLSTCTWSKDSKQTVRAWQLPIELHFTLDANNTRWHQTLPHLTKNNDGYENWGWSRTFERQLTLASIDTPVAGHQQMPFE